MSEKEYPVKIDEAELAKRVDPLSYAVLRDAATETAFTGEYTDTETIGVYKCKACSAELFRSETKFHSGCGWPSFYAPTESDAVELLQDRSLAPRIRRGRVCSSYGSTLVYQLRCIGPRRTSVIKPSGFMHRLVAVPGKDASVRS